jgi:putative radical SAM enzyme (TIGR03279 family)
VSPGHGIACSAAPAGGATDAGVVVAAVRPRSPAAAAGLLPGDRIVAVNGEALRDVIDFHFHGGEPRLRLSVERGTATRSAVLVRRGPDLGLELEPPRPSDIATCGNKCVFCFIHQLPRGMRKSLYVKDDDFRLSFLHGNYITLTDLDEDELARIEAQRLSPLYVSVHATDPELRHRLLGQPRVKRDLMPIMARLARAGIAMHAQIVLCPGWNDGPALERSVRELAGLHPAVRTTAVVPVGLTRHRERLPELRPVSDDEARALVAAIEGWQAELHPALGTRFVFAADELYLQAGAPLPPACAYEGFAIAEDGVGLVRRFADGWARARRRAPARLDRPRRVSVVTGEMFAPRLAAFVQGLHVDGLDARVVAVANEWFGRGIGVAGLLTGQDIQSQLACLDPGDLVLIPAVALRDGAGVFLDDLAPADLSAALGVPVSPVEPTAAALLRALLGG